MLILFYKTRLSRLNFIALLTFLDTFISFALDSSTLSFFFKSFKNFIDIVDLFIKIIFNKAFAIKSEKKKKDKEREKEEENKKIKDTKKKVNKNKKFRCE